MLSFRGFYMVGIVLMCLGCWSFQPPSAGATTASGITYYVDAVNGNDSNDGKTTPWKTLSKVSSHTFLPGDQILLKRGDIWYESLVVPSSGAVTSPIVFGAYGTGNDPVLDEQNIRWPAVEIFGKSYVTVSNLSLQNSTNVTVYVYDSSYINVEHCAIKDSYSTGISVSGTSPGAVLDSNSYTMNPSFISRGDFIHVLSSVDSLTVSNNTSVFNGNANNDGIIVLDVNNALIYGNTVYHATEGIGVKGYTRNVTGAQVHDNAIYDTRNNYGDGEAIEFTGNYRVPWHVSGSIYRNFVVGGPYTDNGISGVYAINSQVYDNIVFGPALDAAFHFSSYCQGIVFYNNTVHNVPFGVAIYSGSTARIVDNIFSHVSLSAINIDIAASATEDYNVFYSSGPNENVARGAHGIFANPLFVNADPSTANDVKLQPNSPAINSGLVLQAPFNLLMDPLDTTMPYSPVDRTTLGSGWERGAFAFRGDSSTAGVPVVNAITPGSGSGATGSFTASFSDSSGYTNLRSMNILFNSSLNGASGCWLRYYAPNNSFYLESDSGNTVLGPLAPGSSGSLTNGQCVLNGAGSSISASGDTLSVTVSITFKSSFAGAKTVYSYASDNAGNSGGWQKRGSWTVK